jgi:hypothetical protein
MVTGSILNIEGQSGFDTVNCGQAGLTAGLRGTINVSNAAQYTQLIVDDSADPLSRAITLDAIPPLPGDTHPRGRITGVVPGTINYRAYDMKDPLTIRAGSGGNTVVVNNTPVSTLGYVGGNTINLNTGTGADNVTVNAIGAGTTLNMDGQGSTDAVLVGNNGSVQGVLGTLNLANKNAYEVVTIDDTGDGANRMVTIGVNGAIAGNTQGSVTGLAPGIINFIAADVTNFTLNGGGGANTYTVSGTPTSYANGLFGPTLTLNAGAGSDIVNVMGMGNGTGLIVNGQGGDDAMSVNYSTGNMPLKHTVNFDGGTSGAVGDSLSIKGNAAGETFAMTAGNINKGANGHVGYGNVEAVYVDTGTFNANADVNLPALVAQSAATTLDFNSGQTIGKLCIDAAHVATAMGGTSPLALSSLLIVNNGRLDLADNAMTITYGNTPDPLAAMRGYLSSGYHDGAWDGLTGITSSAAQNDAAHHTGIGYADSPDGTGINPMPNSIVFKYTLYGDANLDRKVDLTDFTYLAASFNGNNTTWTRGDFNYDAKTDLTDFTYLAANFNQTLPAAPVPAVRPTVVASSVFSTVPLQDAVDA